MESTASKISEARKKWLLAVGIKPIRTRTAWWWLISNPRMFRNYLFAQKTRREQGQEPYKWYRTFGITPMLYSEEYLSETPLSELERNILLNKNQFVVKGGMKVGKKERTIMGQLVAGAFTGLVLVVIVGLAYKFAQWAFFS